jgi:anti-anti-sigma regulatory factor
VQTLLADPRPASIVPAPRVPEHTPAPAQAPAALTLTQGLAEHPALLRTRLAELLSTGTRTLEVDVSAVPVLPAAALRRLLEADTALRRRGGRVRLLNATPRSIRVLAASRALHLTEPAAGSATRGGRH